MKTWRLRRAHAEYDPNPYCLFEAKEVREIGGAIGVRSPRELVRLRRHLRDCAKRCFDERARLALFDAPSKRAKWLEAEVLRPTRALSTSLNLLIREENHRLADILRETGEDHAPGKAKAELLKLKSLLDRLDDLVSNVIEIRNPNLKNSPHKTEFSTIIVNELSQLFEEIAGRDMIKINSRYPKNSPYMVFISSSGSIIIGKRPKFIDQMKRYVKGIKNK